MSRSFTSNSPIDILDSIVAKKPIVNSAHVHRYPTFFSLCIATVLCLSLLVSYPSPSVLAQSSNGGGGGATNQYQGGQGQVLEKISDKGSYRVQIMWNALTSQGGNAMPSGNAKPSPTIPKQGFEMEIDFLNASAPLPTGKTVPQKESGIRSETSLGEC
jgi:hypothetical protein